MPAGTSQATARPGNGAGCRPDGPRFRSLPGGSGGIVAHVRVRPTNLVALLTAPAFAAAVAPFAADLHWAIDLLACFPVQAMGALSLATLTLLVAKRWRLALPYALGAAIAAAAVLPDWLVAPAPAVAPATLRLASLNLLRGNEHGLAALLANVREQQPDVVFCSEVTPSWLTGLRAALTDYPHQCAAADPGYYGVALFSRWPLRDAAVVPLGVTWAPAIRAVVDTPGGPLGLLGVHTPRPGNGERAANLAKALAAIPAAIGPLPTTRVVVGDFNSTPWNHAFRTMLATAGLIAATADAFRPTWPARLPWLLRVPIDHVLVDRGMQLVDADVGPSFGSDHLPLFVTLRAGSEAVESRR